jgi:hypothetical protein
MISGPAESAFDVIDAADFRKSFRYATELAEWYSQHQLLPDNKRYVKAVGGLSVPVDVLDCLPVYQASRDRKSRIAVAPDVWESILSACKAGGGNSAGSHRQTRGGAQTWRTFSQVRP